MERGCYATFVFYLLLFANISLAETSEIYWKNLSSNAWEANVYFEKSDHEEISDWPEAEKSYRADVKILKDFYEKPEITEVKIVRYVIQVKEKGSDKLFPLGFILKNDIRERLPKDIQMLKVRELNSNTLKVDWNKHLNEAPDIWRVNNGSADSSINTIPLVAYLVIPDPYQHENSRFEVANLNLSVKEGPYELSSVYRKPLKGGFFYPLSRRPFIVLSDGTYDPEKQFEKKINPIVVPGVWGLVYYMDSDESKTATQSSKQNLTTSWVRLKAGDGVSFINFRLIIKTEGDPDNYQEWRTKDKRADGFYEISYPQDNNIKGFRLSLPDKKYRFESNNDSNLFLPLKDLNKETTVILAPPAQIELSLSVKGGTLTRIEGLKLQFSLDGKNYSRVTENKIKVKAITRKIHLKATAPGYQDYSSEIQTGKSNRNVNLKLIPRIYSLKAKPVIQGRDRINTQIRFVNEQSELSGDFMLHDNYRYQTDASVGVSVENPQGQITTFGDKCVHIKKNVQLSATALPDTNVLDLGEINARYTRPLNYYIIGAERLWQSEFSGGNHAKVRGIYEMLINVIRTKAQNAGWTNDQDLARMEIEVFRGYGANPLKYDLYDCADETVELPSTKELLQHVAYGERPTDIPIEDMVDTISERLDGFKPLLESGQQINIYIFLYKLKPWLNEPDIASLAASNITIHMVTLDQEDNYYELKNKFYDQLGGDGSGKFLKFHSWNMKEQLDEPGSTSRFEKWLADQL